MTKQATTISIIVNSGLDSFFRLDFPRGADIRKLSHDIAIAIQDYYVRNGK